MKSLFVLSWVIDTKTTVYGLIYVVINRLHVVVPVVEWLGRVQWLSLPQQIATHLHRLSQKCHCQLHSACSVFNFSTKSVGSRRELVANSIPRATPTRVNSTVESRRYRRCVLGFIVSTRVKRTEKMYKIMPTKHRRRDGRVYWIRN